MNTCKQCGKPLERPKMTYCKDCLREHKKAACRAWRERHAAELAEEAHKNYIYYKTHGICAACHTREAMVTPFGKRLIYCDECHNRRWKRTKKKA